MDYFINVRLFDQIINNAKFRLSNYVSLPFELDLQSFNSYLGLIANQHPNNYLFQKNQTWKTTKIGLKEQHFTLQELFRHFFSL